MKNTLENAILATSARFARMSEKQLAALTLHATRAESNLRAYGRAVSPLETASDGAGGSLNKRDTSPLLAKQHERALEKARCKREGAKESRRFASRERSRRDALADEIDSRAAYYREREHAARSSPAEREADELRAASQWRAAIAPEIHERAIARALADECFSFMVANLAALVTDYRIRRFQERRLGMKRKPTTNGKAIWQPLADVDTLNADVSLSTREEMQSAARAALLSAACEGAQIGDAAFIAAHRAARMVLNHALRDTKRERAVSDAARDFLAENDEPSEEEIAALDEPTRDAVREILADDERAALNAEIDTARQLAIERTTEKARRALAAFWANVTSRKAAFGLREDIAFLDTARAALDGSSLEWWHKKGNASRDAFRKRAALFSSRLRAGLKLIGESRSSLAEIYGEEIRIARAAPNASDAARILPIDSPRESRDDFRLTRKVFSADKVAMLRTARRESRAAAILADRVTAWQS